MSYAEDSERARFAESRQAGWSNYLEYGVLVQYGKMELYMNIQEAKEEIKRSVNIYLAKDRYGNYRVPSKQQRPIFLIGAPGIGKTAIMEQIASELNLSIISYSMAHHTRQSAIGLPMIVERNYNGVNFHVSQYTLSEIITSIYECIERTGRKEGILFLDEINCVSETLTPSMLGFLQYKTFGNHAIPQGWIIVTAGNPPEYNRSVHEFDIATMDRLKVIEVVPELSIWKQYAEQMNLHRAIITFLDIRRECFYLIETTSSGKNYVTPRGWEDLSEALLMYEEMKYPVTEALISQYLRSSRIAAEFATYYELYAKYRQDYRIREILNGIQPDEINERAKNASTDERLTVTQLLLEAILPKFNEHMEKQTAVRSLLLSLRQLKSDIAVPDADVPALLSAMAKQFSEDLQQKEKIAFLTPSERHIAQYPVYFVQECLRRIQLASSSAPENQFAIVSEYYSLEVEHLKKSAEEITSQLSFLFAFVENCWEDNSELLIVVTQLSINEAAAAFISEYGCDPYYKYQNKFMLYERGKNLEAAVNAYVK